MSVFMEAYIHYNIIQYVLCLLIVNNPQGGCCSLSKRGNTTYLSIHFRIWLHKINCGFYVVFNWRTDT